MIEKINARVFVTVAESGSYRKAADLLGYTQAGISYIISAMEDEAGFRFFDREYGGVHLTAEGRQLLPHMQELVDRERMINDEVDRINGLETGHIRLLSFNSVIICWLPDILKGFQKKYPGITVELIACDGPEEAIRMILNDEADCGFIAVRASDRIDMIHLRDEPDVAVVAKNHPMAGEKVFPVSRMGDFPFIGMPEYENHDIYDMAKEHGISFNRVMTVNTDYGAFSMINKNLGFGIYPRMVVDKCRFPVKAVPIDHGTITPISIGVRSLDRCSAATTAFIDYVRESYPEEEL